MSFPLFLLRRARRVARIIGLLSVVVAVSGCSAIKLGYNNLPELAGWWLGGYVDFDDAQKQKVREDLQRLQAWHRAQELPRLAQLLRRMEQMAPADTTAAQVCALEPDLRARLQAVLDEAEPLLAANALTLTPAQLQQLERHYARKNRHYTREWVRLEPQEQLDKRLKQVVERAETLYGSLDDAQRVMLREQLRSSPFSPALVLAERRRRQQDALEVLRRVTTPTAARQEARVAVRGLLDRTLQSPDPAFRAYVEALRQESCRLAATLHNGMGPAQREFAARRLRGWQRDFAELAADR